MNIKSLENSDVLRLYRDILQELRDRKIIRSKNVIGDIGEFLVIDFYNKTKNLPKLQEAPPSTKNIDALSRNGERYSIKCTTNSTTGVFFGLPQDYDANMRPLFEYVIVIQLNENYEIKSILELDWDTFLKHKRWHTTVKAWYLQITKSLASDAKIIFPLS